MHACLYILVTPEPHYCVPFRVIPSKLGGSVSYSCAEDKVGLFKALPIRHDTFLLHCIV